MENGSNVSGVSFFVIIRSCISLEEAGSFLRRAKSQYFPRSRSITLEGPSGHLWRLNSELEFSLQNSRDDAAEHKDDHMMIMIFTCITESHLKFKCFSYKHGYEIRVSKMFEKACFCCQEASSADLYPEPEPKQGQTPGIMIKQDTGKGHVNFSKMRDSKERSAINTNRCFDRNYGKLLLRPKQTQRQVPAELKTKNYVDDNNNGKSLELPDPQPRQTMKSKHDTDRNYEKMISYSRRDSRKKMKNRAYSCGGIFSKILGKSAVSQNYFTALPVGLCKMMNLTRGKKYVVTIKPIIAGRHLPPFSVPCIKYQKQCGLLWRDFARECNLQKGDFCTFIPLDIKKLVFELVVSKVQL